MWKVRFQNVSRGSALNFKKVCITDVLTGSLSTVLWFLIVKEPHWPRMNLVPFVKDDPREGSACYVLHFRTSVFLLHLEKFFKQDKPHSSTIEASLPAIENKHLLIRISYFCELWYQGTRGVSNNYTLGFTQDQNQRRTKTEEKVKEGQNIYENYVLASTNEQRDQEHCTTGVPHGALAPL